MKHTNLVLLKYTKNLIFFGPPDLCAKRAPSKCLCSPFLGPLTGSTKSPIKRKQRAEDIRNMEKYARVFLRIIVKIQLCKMKKGLKGMAEGRKNE